jgi:two-component system response regulator AtoC
MRQIRYPAAVPRVLIVDDEENIRLVLRTLLRKHGYEVETASSGEDALARYDSIAPDFVITDVRMSGMSGIELVQALAAKGALAGHTHAGTTGAVVIVMSAYGSVELALEAMKAGAYDYVQKPFKQDEVLLALRKAEEREQLRREVKALKDEVRAQSQFEELLGKSAAMKKVFHVIERAAEHRATVMIQGESGTGKELVARALHRRSPRAKAPFVAVNCGAIPAGLLESELFGHKRGAFTDASSDRAGLFEAAHEGTLFLDEVGEMPQPLQVKLLRVLQEGTLRRLGETKDREVDVRVVAATVRDLGTEVAQGRFREDLFYRLNVLPLVVPPLRDRREDIPMLAEHFVERNNVRMKTKVRGLTANALKRLLAYGFPGNVRELENVIERAMVLADGELLDEQDLPDKVIKEPSPLEMVLSSDDLSVKKATHAIEATLIKRALLKTGGNRTAAAKLLEISHRALLYKLKDYNIR